ncbi:hypothetical protein [Kribbella italica]|uniref:Uncharacterized protein n=1 Tax=Kribbella italica TaxID=1540520 RepID=A0A7W9JAT0_9ACTN|nr:hypothetical protein [Kribbella italica]MBB5838718.1 hypothetical protein [Kribbella italica]
MDESSQTGAPSCAPRKFPRLRPLARLRRTGRAALVAKIDDLYDAPLDERELVRAIAQVIYDGDGGLRYRRRGDLAPRRTVIGLPDSESPYDPRD